MIQIFIDTDCTNTDCIYTDCLNTVFINTDCIYTDCIDANYITMDYINANNVNTYNRDTIFCDSLDCGYEYAQVMSSLDFDNVKSYKILSNIPGSILTGLLLAPMAYQISCQRGLATAHRLKISFEEGSKDIKISLESYKPN